MKSKIKYSFWIVIVIIGSMVFSGCGVVEKIGSWNGILEPPPDWELGELLEAEYAFYAENYTLSEELFTKVFDDSSDIVFVNQALYGLGCLCIAMAEDTDELRKALEMLAKWEEPGPEKVGFEENPRLIITALNLQIDQLECAPEIRYVTSKKSGAVVRKQKEEIEELQATIQKLRYEISVLEAIDQEIQEKRKPL